MSAPEIFCPPRNRVPLPGCSNMEPIVKVFYWELDIDWRVMGVVKR
jgi:hypothetical protein